MKKRESFIFYRSFFEAIKELSTENQAEIYNAISDYCLNFLLPKFNGISLTVWTLIKPQLDANIKRFENGNKPKSKQTISKSKAKIKQHKSKPEANNNDNNNDNDKIGIDFVKLLSFINSTLSREYKKINKAVQAKYRARLKEGYTKEDIVKAIQNASRDQYHIETNYKYLTPEFFSRADKLDRFGTSQIEVKDWAKIREALPPSEINIAKQIPDLLKKYCEKYKLTEQELLTLHDGK
jgi:uncharacterized phage protein (TIGR02220 family)